MVRKLFDFNQHQDSVLTHPRSLICRGHPEADMTHTTRRGKVQFMLWTSVSSCPVGSRPATSRNIEGIMHSDSLITVRVNDCTSVNLLAWTYTLYLFNPLLLSVDSILIEIGGVSLNFELTTRTSPAGHGAPRRLGSTVYGTNKLRNQ